MKNKIRKFLNKHKIALYFISIIFNIPFLVRNIFKINKVNLNIKGAFIGKVKLKIRGKNNKIYIDEFARLDNCEINMFGDNCKLYIGKWAIIKNTNLWFENFSTIIKIGEKTTFENVHIAALEDFNEVYIGDDCMFSRGIEIRTGDSHKILDENNSKINNGQSIYIGDHVWLGANTTVLKGVKIYNNSIVGIGSIVTKDIPIKSLAIGIPAKVKKSNVSWSR